MMLAIPAGRWRIAVSGLLVVLFLLLVLGTSPGRSGVARFLGQFRSERQAEAALSTGQIADIQGTLTALEALGTVSGLDTLPELRPVASLAEASQFVGFPVLEPDAETFPGAISSTPTSIRVLAAHELRFRFDREKARAHFQSIGQGDVNLPERFNGATLVIHTPPGALLEYSPADDEAETPFGLGMVLGEAGALEVDTEGGVSLDDFQEFLVDLPEMSPDTTQQIYALDEWRTALPLPIPLDQIIWERATIAGVPGLLLNDNTGLGSAALWQRDGRVYAIAGALKAREVQRVADSLR